MSEKKRSHPPSSLSWTVWGIGALLYLFGFYQRVAPAVMTKELMADFRISATALGGLSAFYFYSYVAMQIPTGILADSMGPRRLLSFGAFMAAAGSFLFGLAQNYIMAGAGRLIIGASVAVAWVSMLKLAAHWFDKRFYAAISGVALLFGIIGAVTAGVPLRILIDTFGWRMVMTGSGIFSLAIFFFAWIFVKDDPGEKGYKSYAPGAANHEKKAFSKVLSDIISSFADRNILLLLLIPSGLVSAILTFSGLWGVPYLKARFDADPRLAAAITSSFMVAWAIGGPILGWATDRMGKRKPLFILCAGISATGWILLLYTEKIPLYLFVPVLLGVGFASGCIIISFAIAKESMPINLAGTASGIVNAGIMTGPMIMQPIVGLLLDRNWGGEMAGTVRIYDAAAYRAAFVPMAAWTIASFLLLFFITETYCTQKE